MFFRILVVVALLCAVSAFVPAARRSVSARQMTMEDAAAAPAPPATPVAPKVEFSRSLPFLIKPKNLDGMIGNAEFDPFGFSEAFDVKWMREAELKHGRVSMLAVVGWLVQAQGVHLPSDTGLYDVANPIDAVFHVGAGPLLQIVLGVGALEWLNHDGKMTMTDMHEGSSRVPGEFANPIYGAKQLKGKSESVVADIKLKELKNGRLAMMAIGGLVHQTIVTGTTTFGAFPNPQLYGL